MIQRGLQQTFCRLVMSHFSRTADGRTNLHETADWPDAQGKADDRDEIAIDGRGRILQIGSHRALVLAAFSTMW